MRRVIKEGLVKRVVVRASHVRQVFEAEGSAQAPMWGSLRTSRRGQDAVREAAVGGGVREVTGRIAGHCWNLTSVPHQMENVGVE